MSDALASLERLVGDGSGGACRPDPGLLDRVMELYELTAGQCSEADIEAFGSVMERLAYAGPVEKRAALANRLARDSTAPRQFMRRLAYDAILVSRPVLQYSDRLDDRDLVTLVQKLEEDHRLAIAHRLTLPASVTDKLVALGEPPVRVRVVKNNGAVFSKQGVTRLKELAEEDPALRRAMELRPDLKPGLLPRIAALLHGAALPAIARLGVDASRSGPEPVLATQAESRACELVTEAEDGPAMPAETYQPTEAAQVARRAVHDRPPEGFDVPNGGKVTERALAEMARVGWVSGTINCMAKLTGLDEEMTAHCLLKADLPALMVLCKAHRFASSTFGALLQFREAKGNGGVIDTVALLKRYEAMQSHTAKRIIQFADKKLPKGAETTA